MPALIVIVIVAAAVIAALLITLYGLYRFVFGLKKGYAKDPYDIPKSEQYQKGRDRMVALIKELDDIPFEKVETKSFDGLTLRGRYYHVVDGAPIHIQMHGYHSTPVRDLCGGNKVVRETGANTLTPFLRGHGMDSLERSDGNALSFGIKERRDVLSWINYVIGRFENDVEIYLDGVSMGAATVLMALDLELPENVKGVSADCPFSSPEKIIRKVAADWHYPSWIVPLVMLSARIYGGFSVRESSAEEAVKKAKVPVLLLHGEDDRFVPCYMSREIELACASDCERYTFPGAAHGISYLEDTPKYTDAVHRFIELCEKRAAERKEK